MDLRTIDKIGIATLLIFQLLLLIVTGSIIIYLLLLALQILVGVTIKLVNMYRIEAEERVNKKRGEGLSGLFC